MTGEFQRHPIRLAIVVGLLLLYPLAAITLRRLAVASGRVAADPVRIRSVQFGREAGLGYASVTLENLGDAPLLIGELTFQGIATTRSLWNHSVEAAYFADTPQRHRLDPHRERKLVVSGLPDLAAPAVTMVIVSVELHRAGDNAPVSLFIEVDPVTGGVVDPLRPPAASGSAAKR